MILNLTQHRATPDQQEAGVVELEGFYKEELVKFLNFNTLPSRAEVLKAAEGIAALARLYGNQYHLHNHHGVVHAMIGGAPFLMGALENALMSQDVVPMYAFSVRESVESISDNGVVTKTAVFKHLGFVEV